MDQPLVFELIQNSYKLVVQKLPVKQKEQLKELTI
jgi:predicted DNA-binding protein (MmcQ/YjbR family)